MVQPTPYAPTYSFTDHASGSPSAQPPGVPLDNEFDNIASTLSKIIYNLSLIQRDDTTLRSNSVGIPQLDGAALALIAGGTFAIRGVWATAQNYALGDFVAVDDLVYVVVIPHTSGVFATDLAANKLVRAFNPETIIPPVIIPSTSFGSLSALRAADPALLSYVLTDPVLGGLFAYETVNAPYIEDGVNVIKLNDVLLSVGALVRQTSPSALGQTGEETIAAMKAIPVSALSDGVRITVKGFYAAGDGGGGDFIWNAASVAAAITGFVEPLAGGGAGRWVRQHGGTVTDKMAGAKVDGATFDDAAFAAVASLVSVDPSVSCFNLAPGGISKVLPTGAASTTVFSIASKPGFVVNMAGRTFATARTYAECVATGNSAVFRFLNCPGLKITGMPKFTGDVTKAQIAAAASAYGAVGIVLDGNCSFADIEAEGFGILEPILANRAPRITLNPNIPPFIGAGGTGYTVGDTLTIANIGSAAQVNATVQVTAAPGGVVTAVSVINPGRFPVFFDGNISGATKGFAVTGGTGTGAKISPYTLDYDDQQTADKSRFCKIKARYDTCFYGFNGQFNVEDSDIDVAGERVYRAFFLYGTERNRVRAKIRDQHISSVVASVAGIPTSAKIDVTILPAIEVGFAIAGGNAVVGSLYSGVSGVLDLEIDGDANRIGSAATGQYIKISKFAAGADDASPRGHIVRFAIGGKWVGRGSLDGGISTNIMGTDVNYSDASWNGDKLDIVLKDGLTITDVETTWGLAFNANALRSLTVGKVNLSCAIKLDPLASGIGLAPRGRVIVDKDAVFSNRYATVGGHYGLDNVVFTADITASANMTGSRFLHNGGATTLVVNLPPAASGLEFSFFNTSAAGQLHIDCDSADRIGDGATFGGYGKKLRLTDAGARVKLVANHANPAEEWLVEHGVGTRSFEP